AGGVNVSAYSEPTGAWSSSSATSGASGCTAGIGSRYTGSAAGPPSFKVIPPLTPGGVYSIEVTAPSSTASPDIVVSVSAVGGTLSMSSTTAFRNTAIS